VHTRTIYGFWNPQKWSKQPRGLDTKGRRLFNKGMGGALFGLTLDLLQTVVRVVVWGGGGFILLPKLRGGVPGGLSQLHECYGVSTTFKGTRPIWGGDHFSTGRKTKWGGE